MSSTTLPQLNDIGAVRPTVIATSIQEQQPWKPRCGRPTEVCRHGSVHNQRLRDLNGQALISWVHPRLDLF